MRLFVSFAHVDEVRVEEFAEILRAGGFDPWWDDRLEPGDEWKVELRNRIAACDAFVCMLSTDAVESEWCRWELDQAAKLSKPIIPILLRTGTPIPPTLNKLQFLDASAGLHNVEVAKLVGKLARLKQSYNQDYQGRDQNPNGLPARFRQPLPKDYRTVAQAYLQTLTPDMSLFYWSPKPVPESSTSRHIVGMDFGTTFSSVAVHREGLTELIPNDFGETSTLSAVAIASDGTPLVGSRAADFILQRPERGVLEVKRLLGHDFVREFGGTPVLEVDGLAYTPVHLAAFVLRRLRKDAESHLQCSIDKVVLAAPAYFDQSQFAALMQAAKLAGLNVVRVLAEPVAACIGANWHRDQAENLFVYDLGGGTFDASIIDYGEGVFEVKAVKGDTRLGGADFDRVIVDYCVQNFEELTGVELAENATALMRIRDAAERTKITLSTARTETVSVPFIVSAGSTMLHLGVDLTRTRYNELTHSLVARTVALTREALEDASYSPDNIDRVLVVGRASRAPSVSTALKDLFGARIRTAPDQVVALGAATQGAILSGQYSVGKVVLLLDSLTHTLRIQVAGGRTTPVLLRNTPFPTQVSLPFTGQRPSQNMLIRVVAGESSWAERNLLLAELKIQCKPGTPVPTRVEVTMDIDANSHLKISVGEVGGPNQVEASVSLRQNAEWKVLEHERLSHQNELLVPIRCNTARLAPLVEASLRDTTTVQRWIGQAVTDLILSREERSDVYQVWWKEKDMWLRSHHSGDVPFASENIFNHIPFERELLVDLLEERFGRDLTPLRTCLSIKCIVEKLVAAVPV
jgi:molecular chaperone DnaK